MRFSSPVLVLVGAALARAQNAFSFTTLTSVTAGTPFNITWVPSTGTQDTVTLVLRQGDSKDLATTQTIAARVPNSGSYLWTPPTSLVAGSGYAFQIVDDGNPAIVNYSSQFDLISTNTVSAPASSSTSSASTATASHTSASASTTASSSPSASRTPAANTTTTTTPPTMAPTSAAGSVRVALGSGGVLALLGMAVALL